MSPEFGSTIAIFPIDEETINYLELTGRSDEQLALVEAYAKEQGLWHDADAEPRSPSTSSSTSAPSSPRSPARSARRTGSQVTDAKESFRDALPTYVDRRRPTAATGAYDEAVEESFPASDPAAPSDAHGRRPAPHTSPCAAERRRPRRADPVEVTLEDGTKSEIDHGARDDRRDHLVHQHLEPVGDDRRGAAGEEGRREGPAAQAVGQDDAGAGLQGRHRTTTRRPSSRRTWTSSASTWSATAAPPASATPAR